MCFSSSFGSTSAGRFCRNGSPGHASPGREAQPSHVSGREGPAGPHVYPTFTDVSCGLAAAGRAPGLGALSVVSVHPSID